MNVIRNQEWNRDELILTLDLYKRVGGRIPDVRDSEVIELSSILAELSMMEEDSEAQAGRSRPAIIFKMSNFRALDPEAGAKGKSGFSHVGSLDRIVWQEFAGNPEALESAARLIRKRIRAGQGELEPLRANLHILRLLGDQLIGSPRLAVFELVKNAYDADAKVVTVCLDLEDKQPFISIRDDGCGMSLDTIRNGWLQIGTPLKRQNRDARTPRFNRMPLGEKGVGRLAAFKLGDRIEVTTKQEGGIEYNLVMDLENILGGDDGNRENLIEDVRVRVRGISQPETFYGKQEHGTLIRVSKLRPELNWSRGELRDLQRLINSLASPFQEIGKFKTRLEVPGRQNEMDNLPDIGRMLEQAMWVYSFRLDEKAYLTWTYQFKPPALFRGLKQREVSSLNIPSSDRLELNPEDPEPDMPIRPPKDRLFATSEDLAGIGPIDGKLYVFDLRGEVLKHLGGSRAVKSILEYQSGIRVYRDGIRVFNYGEPGDDWLGLNIRRVNKPGKTIATNSLVCAIHLSMDKSTGLEEKTNREGFDENEIFKRFRRIVLSLVEHLNFLRQEDRKSLDLILKGDMLKEDAPTRFQKSVDEILNIARNTGVLDQISKPIERVRKEYETLQEVVVSSGAGLNLALVFHEVDREARKIADGLKKGENTDNLKALADNLVAILDGFSSLLRKTGRVTMPVSTLVKRAIQLNQGRFKAHNIICSCPLLQGEEEDFKISGAFNFYLETLMNLIDNAIYWTRRKAELEGSGFHPAIQIRTLPEWAAEGPSLAVLDNGPGFSISAEEATRAFASTRLGGMGLGLYFAHTAMEANGGDLLIPQSIEDLEIETVLDGAAVVMRFKRVR